MVCHSRKAMAKEKTKQSLILIILFIFNKLSKNHPEKEFMKKSVSATPSTLFVNF